MLIIALVLALIGLTALVTAIVTSNELIAWVCIGASVIGVLLLIVDALRERSRGGAAPADAGGTDVDAAADTAVVEAVDYPEDDAEAEPETVVAEAVSDDEAVSEDADAEADVAEAEEAEGDEAEAADESAESEETEDAEAADAEETDEPEAAGADEACCARLGAAARIRLPKATAAIQRERVMSSFPTAFRQ